MQILKQIFKSQYIIGTLFYSFPSFFSIIISLISIPIFLKFSNPDDYANFLISHFVLTIALITNLNIGRITTINIAKKRKSNSDIFFTSIIFTFLLSFLFTLLIFLLFLYIINFFQLNTIEQLTDLKILLGLFLTNIYLTLEGYYKGNLNYKLLSFFNLFFYSISLSIPSIFVLYNINIDIFTISLIIKLIVVISMFIFALKKFTNYKFKYSKSFIKDCINNSKWMTLNTFLNQIYNYLDKYLIKIFLDNLVFIYYTISQQLTSKLGDPLLAYNNVFIAKTFKKKNNESNNLSYSSLFYCIYIFTIFVFLYFFLEILLKLWLGFAYSEKYFELIKVFFLISTLGSYSKLIIDYYDIANKSKQSSKIELLILLPFIAGIVFSIINKNIYYFLFLILLKELITLTIRFYYIRNFFYFKKFIYIQLILIIFNSVSWFYNLDNIYFVIIQFLHLIIFLPLKSLRKFYKI